MRICQITTRCGEYVRNDLPREINTVISRGAVTIIRAKRPVEIFRSHQSALSCISKEGEKEIGVDSRADPAVGRAQARARTRSAALKTRCAKPILKSLRSLNLAASD